jgi:hypothetical protein
MSKLLLFAGHIYDHGIGVDDFKGKFESIDEILKWLNANPEKISKKYTHNWTQIADAETMQEVAYYNNYGDNDGWHIDED